MCNRNQNTEKGTRYAVLDILRGVALLGICLANFPEFALYTFQDSAFMESLPTARIDTAVKYFQYIFVDGKFYTIFSLLFGIGFSLILARSTEHGKSGVRYFYRRMAVLLGIGTAHMLLLWAGDILMLYALLGLLLPLFRKLTDNKLAAAAVILLLCPIGISAFVSASGADLAGPVNDANRYLNGMVGITDRNFPVWLAEKQTYLDVLRFNLAGMFVRFREFIEGDRIFKVMGLFILGLYIGRKRLYADTAQNRRLMKRVRNFGFLTGLPLSVLYAWNAMNGTFGLTGSAVIYFLSVVPLALAYGSAVFLWQAKRPELKIFKWLASPGRMALTNYLGQSVFGIVIFYGIGMGLALRFGLVWIELIAAGVFVLQVILSHIWLGRFRYGPMEWMWRRLTYGACFKSNTTKN